MDDSDDSTMYHPDGSDTTFTPTCSQRELPPSRPQTPEGNRGPESVASDPPSTLRRSTRQVLPVQRLDPSVDERPASPQIPRETSTHRPATRSETIQQLLKLPGFDFTGDTNVFSSRENTRFAILLGAQSASARHEKVVLPSNQGIVCVRVADVFEVCCDEWLEWWQDEPLTKTFWSEAAERLRCHNRHWQAREATADEVYTIFLTYTSHWDKTGRGDTIIDDASWGFELGELTWGSTKAEIDPDLFAKPWDYERASFADEPLCTENAARDFLDCTRDSEITFGPIETAEKVRNADRNRSASRNGNTRSLVTPGEAPRHSRPRTVSITETHQFVLGGGSDVVVVSGPRRRNNNQSGGSSSGRARAIVERSDPNRLLVTFSGFFETTHQEEKRQAQQDDEGKDVRHQAGEDVEMT